MPGRYRFYSIFRAAAEEAVTLSTLVASIAFTVGDAELSRRGSKNRF
jgi:hypothetical protein